MKPSMLAKLDQLAERLEELNSLLAQEDATANMDNFRKMTREHAELGPLVALYHDYVQAGDDIRTAQELLSEQPGDKDPANFVACAATPDRSVIVVYTPSGRFGIKPEAMTPTTKAKIFDPRTGVWQQGTIDQPPPPPADYVVVYQR